MRDLNDLIPADSGWELRTAQDINDVGQIVGYGVIDINGDGIYSERRAFLLTPIIVAPTYSCAGFEPPCRDIMSVKNKNRCVPLKTELLDADGLPITDADIMSPPVIDVKYDQGLNEPLDPTVFEGLPPAEATVGDEFEYKDDRWCYNFKIKDHYQGPGIYTVRMVSRDENEYVIGQTNNKVIIMLER
jgi:hypothetical protein